MTAELDKFVAKFAPDVVFGLVLSTSLAAGSSFLCDPGTPWHYRLGRDILDTGAVPRTDTLTYSKAGAPWVDQSWLFDSALALLVDLGGWSVAIASAALCVAWLYRRLTSMLLADGASGLAAIAASILACGVGSIHFLVRPHLVTFWMVLTTFSLCRSRHKGPDRRIAIIPLLMIPWANCHGGFPAGAVIVLTSAVAHAISGPLDAARRRAVGEYLAVFVLCLVTPLVNPYGLDLYRHVFNLLLESGVTSLIDEFQPMPFGKPSARVFEWVLLALVALPTFAGRELSRFDLVHGLVWLHFALGSIRHAPLFALIAAPGVCRMMDGILKPEQPGDPGPRPRCLPIPALLATVAVAVAAFLGANLGGFLPTRWPIAALTALKSTSPSERLFHEQDWGGLIESECAPEARAFLDDRFELYGKQGILDYIAALEGGPGWDELRDRQGFRLVWVRPTRGLAKRLLRSPAWTVLHRDETSVLFRRTMVTAGPTE